MSARLLGWTLTCNGCDKDYEVRLDCPLVRAREIAARDGWTSDDPDMRPEYRRDYCGACTTARS